MTSQPQLSNLLDAAVILALFAVVGYAIDKLLLSDQRGKITSALTTWWCVLDDLQLERLVPAMADFYLKAVRKIFGRRIGTILLVSTCLSFSATTIAVLAGDYLWYRDLNETLANWDDHRPLLLYPLNLALDLLTLGATFAVISKIRKSHLALYAPYLLLDISLAVVLVLVGFWLGQGLEFPETFLATWKGFRLNCGVYLDYIGLRDLLDDYGLLHSWLEAAPRASGGEWAKVMYAFTTVIPTLFYLGIFIALLLSLASLQLVRLAAMQIFRLDIETEKSIFFYSGVALGLGGSVMRLLAALWE